MSDEITLLPGASQSIGFDVVRQLAVELEQDFGKLDILSNNASGYSPWSETPSAANLQESHNVF